MNPYQQSLFTDLSNLVQTNEAFFVAKVVNPHTGTPFWMFNYRLPSFSDFQQPSALESRGVMFEMNSDDTPKRLASMPFPKFFNLCENPLVMNLDLSLVSRIEVKADGSLISSYYDNTSGVFLKTKGSLISQQATDAYSWITQPQRTTFWTMIQQLTFDDYTVNMEWTSPLNRIVLQYQTSGLVILNVRNNKTGHIYSSIEELQQVCSYNVSPLHEFWVENVLPPNHEEFINSIPTMQGIEGFVVKFKNGLWVKVKTEQYRELHKVKDSINNNKALYASIVNEAADELKSMFFDDAFSINRIEIAESHVTKHFNHLVSVVEDFYDNNKHLDRKSYAIKGQQELEKHMFTLAMEKYIGRPVDFKVAMVKYYDIYPLPFNNVEMS